jgi:polysaccharide export outer membrane protein
MFEKIREISLSLLVTMVIGGTLVPAAAVMAAPAGTVDSYLLGAGDLLTVSVWKNDEFSGDYIVRPDGRITLPLVGDVIAAGRTTDAIRVQLESKLKLFIESPYVSVIVTDAASNVVYVLGKVANPGSYQLRDKLTVLQALALAGGFVEFARSNDMVLLRLDGETQRRYEISFKAILKSEDGADNLLLQRGDTLVVP